MVDILKRISFFILFSTLLISCIEQFDFKTNKEQPAVIIDGFISDISSNEHKKMYGASRSFQVKLKYTSQVKNTIDQSITNAEVELKSDQNEHWDYTEDIGNPGVYTLYYPDFAAVTGVKYKIRVKLKTGEEYESEYESIPNENVRGIIDQRETTELQYEVVSGKIAIKPAAGLDIITQLPDFPDSSFRYFRWDYDVTWKLVAEFTPPSNPVGECWISDIYYYRDFELAKFKGSSPSTDLLFFQTSGHHMAKFGFSIIIRQQEISEKHYQFWSDLKSQEKQSELFAPPPFNIYSNITSSNSNSDVYGFFGVVNEEYYNWFFDKKSLSYTPLFPELCYVPPNHDPANWCGNCMCYAEGLLCGRLKLGEEITTKKPSWWAF